MSIKYNEFLMCKLHPNIQLSGHAVHIYSVSKQLSRVSDSALLLPDNIFSHKSPRDDPGGDVTQTQKKQALRSSC